jgi:hypothetical protein
MGVVAHAETVLPAIRYVAEPFDSEAGAEDVVRPDRHLGLGPLSAVDLIMAIEQCRAVVLGPEGR